MIRYEIYSNVANSDHGLQHYPALGDLAQSLSVREIDTRFIRQAYKEESEINLASSKHAKGVKVRGTSVREIPVESHIKGCLRWMRVVAARADRGLHLEIEKVRSTNGAPLVFAQLFARNQKVFVSGLDKNGWGRLTALTDFSCKEVPKAIQASKSLREEYLARASRPTGFMTMLQRIADLSLAEKNTLAQIKEILAKRDASQLKNLSEAQIVNLGLIHDFVERYEKLVDQFCALLAGDGVLGDLPQMFELLTQGVPFDFLARTFGEFALEEKKAAIRDKRTLVNELRIGLNRGDEALGLAFYKRFMPLVIKSRLRQDPPLYGKAVRLQEIDASLIEGMEVPRKLFLSWMNDKGGLVTQWPDPKMNVPQEVSLGLFEFAVTLILQAKYSGTFRDDALPPPVSVARNILNGMVLEQFELNTLRKLHPNLPPRGVARNLAGKVPVTVGEMVSIQESLWSVLFPMGKLADELSEFILSKYKDQAAQERTKEINTFIMGAGKQINTMNYVLGRAGQTHLIRRAALGAGTALGLMMLDSRDQIRRHGSESDPGDGDDSLIAGYQLLMVRDESRYFPLKGQPDHMASAYAHLLREHVAQLVRRLVSKKLKYLFDVHGKGLFRVIHDHVQWNHRILISEAQLASVLLSQKVFDQARLKDFGYLGKTEGSSKGENAWFAEALEASDHESVPHFTTERARKEVQAAEATLREVVGRYPARAKGAPAGTANRLMAKLMGSEIFDPRAPACMESLRESREAGVLTSLLQGIVSQEKERLLPDGETNEALELLMPGPLAYLTLLKDSHEMELEGEPILVRIKAARYLPPQLMDEASMVVAEQLKAALNAQAEARDLRMFMQQIKEHDDAWTRITEAMSVPLIDQMLLEVVLKLVQPQPPLPKDLAKWPEDQILCLSTSSFDQGKFSKIVAHPERRDVYATLSELSSWLHRFRRLGEELDYYKEVVGDVMEIIAGLNLSAFDAPYITRYGQMLRALLELLSIRPEEYSAEDLAAVEKQARTISRLVRDGYDQERSVALRDRWLSRIAMRVRSMHPNIRLTFVDRLFEQVHPSLRSSQGEGGTVDDEQEKAKREEYQTFSERVRNVIGYRERLEKKQLIVMSPSNTQGPLTLTLVDQLFRLKGVHTPIFADISGCGSFVDQLRTRIPPYRLFELHTL